MSDTPDSAIPQARVNSAAQCMWRLEALFDEALLLQGELIQELVAAQAEGGLSPMCMHEPVFAKLPDLCAAIVSGRSAASDVHKGMGAVAKRLNLEVRMEDSPPVKKWPDIVWPWSPEGSARAADAPASAARVFPLPRRAG